MAQKPNIRPIPGQQRPLTEDEKKVKIMQFLQQKRESFALNILCNMIQGVGEKGNANARCASLVDLAVTMADQLIEKLYPLPEEGDNQ